MAPSLAKIHRRHAYGKDAHTYLPIAIIGAGESGIAMGCRLKEALGFDQFRLFDRQAGIGGSWWINRYPGVACDIPALLYSFSFATKKDWSTLHPSGPEIAQYMADVCEKYAIVDKIQLNTEVNEIRWLEDVEEWEINLTHLVPGTGELARGDRAALIAREGERSVYVKTETVRAKIVVTGAGGLVEPNSWPKSVPGIEDFEGEVMHTAKWNSDVDLKGKDVVVIGSGCSAAQAVPFMSEHQPKSVTQVMRSPPWVQPDPLPPAELRLWESYMPFLMAHVPGLVYITRAILFFKLEGDFLSVFKNTKYARRRRITKEKEYLAYMHATAPKEYHDILTPDYSLGCKRRVIRGDWFKSLHAPNYDLTTMRLTGVKSKSITLGPGTSYPANSPETDEVRDVPADVIVLANGFETNNWLHPLRVVGRQGKSMDELWEERGGAQAYLGIAMDHFPNCFIIFGPNNATGHTSVIFATENAVDYSLNFIKPILDGDVSTYEVTEKAERAWTDHVQKGLQGTVFQRGTCQSWYQTENGWNSSTYPFTQIDYWFRCKFPNWGHWTAKYTPKGRRAQGIRFAFKRFAFVAVVSGVAWLSTHPEDARRWAQLLRTARGSILSVVRDSVQRASQLLQ